MQICPSCGEENPDRFRLCGICGTKLAPDEVAQEVRKTVTVVFSDLKGSTSLGEKLDTESLREVLSLYFNEMRAVLERHGGTVEKYIGDAIMAVFGLPKLHEDDAMRAVRAAYEMKLALERVNDKLEKGWGVRLENRTGVNTGEVVAGDVSAGQRLVTGDTVNTAARLEQNAPTLETLIGEPTYRLVRDAVEVEPVEPLELKGKAERVPAYRLVSATLDEGVARRLDSPIVGRTEELATLLGALDRAESERRAHLVTVFGPAGVGKSRLLREFLSRSGERIVSFKGRCLSYGDGITFWPLAEVTREAAVIGDDDPLERAQSKLLRLLGDDAPDVAERVAAAIGLTDAAFPIQETFWAARRLFEILAAERPAVILIDDIHWAEQTFLDLLQHVTESAEAPIVLVCSSRPELLEDHADWVQERDNLHRIMLEPLSDQDASKVVENLLGSAELDESIRAKVIEAAEGNPLFVEQMLSMLIDDGVLARDDTGRWILLSDVGALTIPPTISALLTARLDRLGATERLVIERSSVVGQVFFRGAVEELVPETVQPYVGPNLQDLVRKELIRPHESMFAGEEAFRFFHILIRDAAYHGLLKRTRAELHERFVDWLERVAPDRVKEYEEIRGYHLEQAYLILIQLGPLDDHGRLLGERGAAYLLSAGRRATARGDMPAAANLLQRAAALLAPNDPARARAQIEAGDALIETGEYELARSVLGAAVDAAASLGDRGSEVTARILELQCEFFSAGGRGHEEDVNAAIQVLEELGDHKGLLLAWRLLVDVYFVACRYGAAEEAARKMIEHARLAGEGPAEVRGLVSLAVSALYGPLPVSAGIELVEQFLERARSDRRAEARILVTLAQLEAMQGRFDRARELYPRSRAVLAELGWRLDAALTSQVSGPVEMLAGDLAAAEAELRRDFEDLERMDDRVYLPTAAAYLGEVLYEQGRCEDAEALISIAAARTEPDDLVSQVLWRSIRAKLLARYGRFDEAEAHAREAVTQILTSDAPDLQGQAFMDLAEVLELAGRTDEAVSALTEALRRFELKGNIASAAGARARLATLFGEEIPTGEELPAREELPEGEQLPAGA